MVSIYKRASFFLVLLLTIFPYRLTSSQDSYNEIPHHDNSDEFELSKISPVSNELLEIPQNPIEFDQDTQIEIDPPTSVLQPTDEWQTIQPGQSIPRGCHVRINFEIGKKEAKWAEGRNTYKFKLPPNDTDQPNNVVSVFDDAVKPKFKSTTYSSENLNKTLSILASMDSTVNDTYILLCLDQLEQLLSDGELAQYLISTEHFSYLISLLHYTNPDIPSATCLVIGSMWQNNQLTQLNALERNLVPILIGLLRNCRESGVDPSPVLFAISTLLRGLPYGLGMQYFYEFNVADVLTDFVMEDSNHRIITKFLRLTTFLLEEYENEMGVDVQLAFKRKAVVESINRSGYCLALEGINVDALSAEISTEMKDLIAKVCDTH